MNRLRDLLLFCHLYQIVFRWCLGHNDGTMGDIGFKCPSGSVFYQGYCFRKETVPMTWEHAETACLRSGMYLAWLEDDIENEYVATHVMSDVNQYWIGLSNTSSKAGQNEVSWSRYRMSEDKTIPVYKGMWKNWQPADFTEENKCVSTLKDKYDNHWTVTNCRKKLPFVCKLMGAPKPHDVIFCGNGGYIHKNWKCDGQNDCGDMSDEIDCFSSCSELKLLEKGGSGSITMTSFDNNAFCTWTIQTPVGVRIKITISLSFHLEQNADVLSVWTGGISLKESNFLGSVTGSLQSQKEFYSQNNYIIMQLSMDGSINVRGGFTVTYETVADSVIWNDLKKLTAGSSWQNLESPLYGTAVPFGLQLEWLITAGSYQVVSLEFLEVDLPTSSSLQVYDGEDLMAPQVFMLNKTPSHPVYISRSKSIRVVLSTDEHEYTKYRGFQLKYKEGCNIEMKQQGTIYSPGYKVGSYPSNVTCVWILTRNTEETKSISLRFTEFKLKSNSDYVEVYNDTAGTALHMGSGLTGTSDITEIFSSTNGYLNVTFKSNLVLFEKGFKAEFSVDCPMLTLSQWAINSVSDKYTALNTEIKLSCQPGYSFKQEEYSRESSVALKCLSGGKWNVSRIPDCQITYCGMPTAIQNGILISATGAKVGDNATYECNVGFTLGGSTAIRCQENGYWDTPPMCYAQQCSPISDPINGNVNITEGSGTDFASVLMFSCDLGYDLLGSVYIHCRSNGTWSHPKPSCTEIYCPIPQVMYGKVESGGDVKYKETAKLKCDAGFIVNGTTLDEKDVMCESDAMFSGLDPCVAKDCILNFRSWDLVAADDAVERLYKTTLESCKNDCNQDEKCNAMFYLNRFCFIIYITNPTLSSYAGSSYFDKVCNRTYRKDSGGNPNDCPRSCNMTNTAETAEKIDECECICIAGYTGNNYTEEIDECASYPCKHGATCTDRVNDYHCYCTEGWTGKNCDQQIDFCTTTTNKCQSGKCFNLIDDKYCRCSPGKRGDTCEDLPDVCNVVNPCSTMGSCRNVNGKADCSCRTNYSGKSCQLLKDFCTGSTTCLHMGMLGTGGTCTNLESGGYNCQCQTGYSGATCQTKITLCSTLNCGSSAQCNDEIGCYCPEGKILTDNKACKQPSNDFDMLFDPQIGDEGAYTTAVLNDTDNSGLSFMLWVRFNKDQKDIENTVILKLGEFAEVKNYSITVWNTTNNFVVDFKIDGSPIEIDDGKWHFIVCSWKQNGESLVAVDGVKVFEDMSLPGILPKVFRIEIGKKFSGRISQVKIWANSLTVIDVYKLDESKDYNPYGSTVVHGWYNYRMNKGVVKKSPTQIEREVCDVPACSLSDKIKPTINRCASDTLLTSIERVYSHKLPNFIDMFDDFNESLSLSSHSGDNTFTWGDYSLLFMASDNNGNTALCHFKLYVRYNKECPAPRTFSSINYCSVSSKDICKLECPSNQQLSLPTPKYIPCSELGVYNPLKPREKIVLPSCGDKTSTTIQIDVSLVYSLEVTCSETYETVMETKLMTDFMHDIFNAWNTVCSTSACENVQISSFCVPASKQIKVALKIRNLRNSIIRKAVGSLIYTPTEVLKILVFDEDAFNAEDIGGAKVLKNQVVITNTLSCPDGFMLIGKKCIACGMGTFYNSTSQNCEFCPVGTYGSTTRLRKCISCESGKTTLGVGYTASSDCVDDCPVGEFWNVTECSLCAKHFYQSVTGKDYCFPCPLGKLTAGQGSNSSLQCYSDCPEGTELQLDGKCVKCPRGYYRSFLEDVCMECPAGITTVGDGSTNADRCYLTVCYKGAYRNRTTNVCEPCPVGEYQPKDLQEECIKCPTKYTTESDRKNNITDCKFYCPEGYEILSAASETCQPCPRGFFKDNSIVFSRCLACPSGFTTEKVNSTSIDSCSINKCRPGQEITFEGGCSDCELDKYQPVDMPTSTDKCSLCKENYGTKQKMSSSSSDCLPMCPEGQFFNQLSMMCEKCPKGSWNNGNSTMKFEDCVACPVNFTTTGPGMTSDDNCTILDCDPGSFISGTDCLLCDYGYYQPARHQEYCIQCGPNLNTSSKGASKQGECQLYCGAGLEGHSSCTPCKEGFVKSGSGTYMCQECTGNFTSNDARTDCTQLFCDKGFYSNTHQSSCIPCNIGYFKKERGNALACTRCPDGFLTPKIASTSAENCDEPFCIPGHYLNSSGVCVLCMIGFYKDVTGNGKCTACPSNLTNPLMGSTTLSNCSIVVCDAGEKRISSNNTCMKCPLGYYQPERGESECIKCGDGLTTKQVGTTTKTGCIPICPAGKEYVSASKTCKECPLGSYKSEIGNNKACTTCPSGYTTAFTGSISVSNCSLPDCMSGTYRSAGGCQICPVGTYQDLNSQESCKNCPSDRNTTETTVATSESFCIKFCLPGQQYDRTTMTCENCPKDFYTNKTISQYCIKCPTGYITYGEGSATCIKLSAPDSGTTQAPAAPVQQTYTFNLKYRATVDCNNMEIRNQIKANILVTIREHLRNLAKRFSNLCSLPEIKNCFASVEVTIKGCNRVTSRKRATEPSTIDVELNIPNLGETVTDNTKNVEIQTEVMLQEDLDTQKAEYTPTGLKLADSTFVGKFVTCTAGYISTNNHQSCEICPAGTYHHSTSNQCMNCAQSSYQDQAGQTSCKNCPDKKYTTSMGSVLESSCVSVENGTSYNGPKRTEKFFLYYYIGVGSAIFVLLVAISVIFVRVFCRHRANKPKRYYYENPITTRTRQEDSYTGLSNSGDYATIDEMREYMNMRTLKGSTASSDIYLTPRGHPN